MSIRSSQPNESDVDRGRALMQMGRYDQALAVLGRAAATRPGDPVPRCLQSACLLSLGRNDEALAAAESAIAAAPDNSWGHRNRALALSRLLRAAEAVASAQEAVRLAPNGALELRLLAESLVKNGQKAEALRAAERARELQPHEPASWVTLSFVAVRSRNFRTAGTYAEAALRLDPSNHAALNNLGVSYRHRWRFIKAFQCYVQSWRLKPQESVARRNIAGLLTSLIILTTIATLQLARGLGAFALIVPLGVAGVVARGLRGLPAPALRVVGRDVVRAPPARLLVIGRAALVVTIPIWGLIAVVVDVDLIHHFANGAAPIAEVLVGLAVTGIVVLDIRLIRRGAWREFRRG